MNARLASERSRRLLALDTATEEAIVALGEIPGGVVAEERWRAGHAHGERLLASLEGLLGRTGWTLEDLSAVVVGTGPGSFTGLRVGMASAKGLAFGLGIPLLGVETVVALAEADAAAAPREGAAVTVVLLPAGPSGRYRATLERSRRAVRLLAPPTYVDADADAGLPQGARLLALDLPVAPAAARRAGERARRGLGEALVRLGGARLLAPHRDELAELVPTYVTLPRGVVAAETIGWSPVLP